MLLTSEIGRIPNRSRRDPARVLIGYVRRDYGGIFDPARAAAPPPALNALISPFARATMGHPVEHRLGGARRAACTYQSRGYRSGTDVHVQARPRMQHALGFHLSCSRARRWSFGHKVYVVQCNLARGTLVISQSAWRVECRT